MNKLYVMVGIPGSGKDYWIKEFVKFEKQFHPDETIKAVSRDEVRFSIIKDEDGYFSKENEVFKEFIKQINDSLAVNDVTIANATHISAASRAKLLKNLKGLKDVHVCAIVKKVNIDICIAQNNNRTGRARVPEDAILNMAKNFTIPAKNEGFNDIIIFDRENNILN